MRLQVFLLTVLAVSTSSTFAQAPPLELTLDWKAIGEQIVERLDLQPGEKVVALAHPGTFREVIPHFRYAVMKSGAIDLGIVDALEQPIPSDWDLSLLTPALRSAREAYRDMFREVDASVMLPGAIPTQPAYAAIQDLLQEGRGRTIPLPLASESQCRRDTRPAASTALDHGRDVPECAAECGLSSVGRKSTTLRGRHAFRGSARDVTARDRSEVSYWPTSGQSSER